MRISLELVQAIASRFFLLKTPHDWLPTSEIHLCHLVWFMHNKLYNSTHLNSFVPACVGDQTAAKMRKIVTHFHLVHVPIDIVVSKGPQICLDHSTYLSSHCLQDTEVSMHNYLYITHAHCNPDSIFYQVVKDGMDVKTLDLTVEYVFQLKAYI